MKSIGGFMFVMGAGSVVLYFLGMEFKLLMWIESWGATIAWVIRILLAVVGAALWLIGNSHEAEGA